MLFEFLNLGLLCFDRFDQQGRQPGVVHSLNVMSVGVAGDYFRNDLGDILSHYANFMFPINLALVGHSLELLDLLQRSCERLDVGLETALRVVQASARVVPPATTSSVAAGDAWPTPTSPPVGAKRTLPGLPLVDFPKPPAPGCKVSDPPLPP